MHFKPLTSLVALATATLALATPAQAVPVIQASSPGNCADVFVINSPGGVNTVAAIPQQVPHGMHSGSSAYGAAISTNKRVEVVNASYDAVPFIALTYQDATQRGYNTARAAIEQRAQTCPNAKFALTGYSEGADVVSHLTADIGEGRGPIAPERLAASVMFSTPHSGTPGAHRAGTAGAPNGVLGKFDSYGAVADRALEICNAGDFVCEAKDNYQPIADALVKVSALQGQLNLNQVKSTLPMVSSQDWIRVVTGIPQHMSYKPQEAEATRFIADRL